MNPVLLLAFIGISTLLLASMLNIGDLNNANNEFLLQTLQQESYKTQEFVSATYDSNNNKVIVATNIPTTIVKYYVIGQNNDIKSTQTLNLYVNGVATFTIPNVSSTDKVYILTSQGNTYVVTQQSNSNDNNVRCHPNQNFTYTTYGGNANIQTIQPCTINVQLTSSLTSTPEYESQYYTYTDRIVTAYRSTRGESYVIMKFDLPAGNYSLSVTKDTLSWLFIVKDRQDLMNYNYWINRNNIIIYNSTSVMNGYARAVSSASCITYNNDPNHGYCNVDGRNLYCNGASNLAGTFSCVDLNNGVNYYYSRSRYGCQGWGWNAYICYFSNNWYYVWHSLIGAYDYGYGSVIYANSIVNPANVLAFVSFSVNTNCPNIAGGYGYKGVYIYDSNNPSYLVSVGTYSCTNGYASAVGYTRNTTLTTVQNGYFDFNNQMRTIPVTIQGNEKLYVIYVNPYDSCILDGYGYYDCGSIYNIPTRYLDPSSPDAVGQTVSQTTQMQLVITRQ
jgi:hypothetical protein